MLYTCLSLSTAFFSRLIPVIARSCSWLPHYTWKIPKRPRASPTPCFRNTASRERWILPSLHLQFSILSGNPSSESLLFQSHPCEDVLRQCTHARIDLQTPRLISQTGMYHWFPDGASPSSEPETRPLPCVSKHEKTPAMVVNTENSKTLVAKGNPVAGSIPTCLVQMCFKSLRMPSLN